MSPFRQSFKRADLGPLTGVRPLQLEYWLRLDLMQCESGGTSSGDHRQFSFRQVIECALLVELAAAGLHTERLQQLMAQLRTEIAKLPPARRAAATYQRYLEFTQKLAELLGQHQDPAYRAWFHQADAFAKRWDRDDWDPRLLDVLAARATARAPATEAGPDRHARRRGR